DAGVIAPLGIFRAFHPPYSLTRPQIRAAKCNPRWRNPDHFENCSNFEQSLPKMVTRRKRWSSNAGSDWPRGSSLVVQVSGGALARTSSVVPPIKIKSKFSGKSGRHNFWSRAKAPLFIFFGAAGLCLY